MNETIENKKAIVQINKTLMQCLLIVMATLHLPCYTRVEIKTQYPNSLSDYYMIIDGTGHTCHVYCEMGQVCDSSGWTRMAYFNMSDPTEECPSGFRLYSQNGVRACGRPVTSGGSCWSLHTKSTTLRSAVDESMATRKAHLTFSE